VTTIRLEISSNIIKLQIIHTTMEKIPLTQVCYTPTGFANSSEFPVKCFEHISNNQLIIHSQISFPEVCHLGTAFCYGEQNPSNLATQFLDFPIELQCEWGCALKQSQGRFRRSDVRLIHCAGFQERAILALKLN
jgi:hypothetical protein